MSAYGVVIVTYNSEAEIGRCLDSLAACSKRAEVVVVDNGSTDGTLEEIRNRPDVTLVANLWNRGFAAACNQGVALLHHDCILLFNPDACRPKGLDALVAACSADGVAAAAGRLTGTDGRLQQGFMVRRLPTAWTLAFEALGVNRLWPANPVNRRYRCFGFDAERAQPVEQPPGAFLMVSRQAWQALGGFDESFFPLWFEDVDFCRRAGDAGYRILYVPAASAVHAGGHSVRKLSSASRQAYWYGTLLSYAGKHFRPGAVRAVSVAVTLGVLLRGFLDAVNSRSFASTIAAIRVVGLAGRYFKAGRSEMASLSRAFADF
ncbi:MAG TPA: glycosyltransferase family 2 protein [Bryobacteraceae bacterium]|nr:glycosyltransferase family 2 protein [Bryobacteraceae bacterium]